MLFNCLMIFLGGIFAILLCFCLDVYRDNQYLKEELRKVKKNE